MHLGSSRDAQEYVGVKPRAICDRAIQDVDLWILSESVHAVQRVDVRFSLREINLGPSYQEWGGGSVIRRLYFDKAQAFVRMEASDVVAKTVTFLASGPLDTPGEIESTESAKPLSL